MGDMHPYWTSLYFAYGSNLNRRQMLERCPCAISVRTHKLLGWRLVFRRTADIVRAAGHTVLGALYTVTEADSRVLDRYEGAPFGRYRRRYFRVCGERVLTYVMNDAAPCQQPWPEYCQVIEEGYRDWNLPMEGLAPVIRGVR